MILAGFWPRIGEANIHLFSCSLRRSMACLISFFGKTHFSWETRRAAGIEERKSGLYIHINRYQRRTHARLQ
jgi:hypothetical protein